MPDISEKSTGQLVDELVTNAFKTEFSARRGTALEEFDARYELLRGALAAKLGNDVAVLIHDLAVVAMATWQAQEVVMSEADDHVVAAAARQAQRLNARRTRLIRELDRLLGDAGISITTKTYG
jgi:hypothetical protein